jgi:hypothetical protein
LVGSVDDKAELIAQNERHRSTLTEARVAGLILAMLLGVGSPPIASAQQPAKVSRIDPVSDSERMEDRLRRCARCTSRAKPLVPLDPSRLTL